MNWFTNKSMVKVTEQIHSHCEHLEEGDVAYRVSYENDGLGEPESYAMCKACSDAANKAEDEIEDYCHDCGGLHKMGDMIEWKWYDFHAPQGDEPLLICKSCKGKEKHRARVEKNREDYEKEMSYYR